MTNVPCRCNLLLAVLALVLGAAVVFEVPKLRAGVLVVPLLGAVVLGTVVLGAVVLGVVPKLKVDVVALLALVLGTVVLGTVVLGVVPKLKVDVVALLALVLGAVVLGAAPNVNAGVVLGAVVLGVVVNAVGAAVPKLKLGVVLGCVADVPPSEGVVEAPNVVVPVDVEVEGTPNEKDEAGAVLLVPKENPGNENVITLSR